MRDLSQQLGPQIVLIPIFAYECKLFLNKLWEQRALFILTLCLWFIGVKNIFPNKRTPKIHVISTLAII